MILNSDIIADLHTHTIFSKHAYSTVKENMEQAVANGIEFLAITDHFYNNGDFIESKNEITRMIYLSGTIFTKMPINVISGGEFNLNQSFNNSSNSIKTDKVNTNVRWRPIGLHSWFLKIKETDINDIPMYFEKAVAGQQDGFIPTAFAHIERELFSCKNYSEENAKDALRKIVEIAVNNNIVLEINESSLRNNEDGAVDRMRYWIPLARDMGAMFSLGTDAHYCELVGQFPLALKIINEFNIPENQILNHKYNIDKLKALV